MMQIDAVGFMILFFFLILHLIIAFARFVFILVLFDKLNHRLFSANHIDESFN
jgi:hypothetical protein